MAKRSQRKTILRAARKARVRKNLVGTDIKPRLCVYKSLNFTYAQLISDDSGTVIASACSRDIDAGEGSAKGKAAAKAVGMKIAELAMQKKVAAVVFDRNGYIYHGRVAAVADGAREAGLAF